MTETPSRRRSRMNRAEGAQHPYTARTEETVPSAEQSQYDETVFMPDEKNRRSRQNHSYHESMEPSAAEETIRPAEEQEPQPSTDYAAYFSREGAQQEADEPAFAPPPSMRRYASGWQEWNGQEPSNETEREADNVYRPRQVTWAEEDREEAIAQSGLGYQVQEEALPERPKKKHVLRTVLILLLIPALLGGAGWLLWEPIAGILGIEEAEILPTETPAAAMATPKPISAYDAAPAAAVSDIARNTIARLSGTLEMEHYIVTDQHIVTRNQRADGSYDFYLFTAEGRLLCYFEGLSAMDMIPQDFGGFYVDQAPWLVTAGGAALVRTSDVEAAINEKVFLHPMYRGWALMESEADGHSNYVNSEGKLMSSLWFSRTFPFTGEYTLAYVDTGATADANGRYLLYVLGSDGTMTRWFSAGKMDDVVAAVCSMAYMSDGSVYHLPDTSAPICVSSDVTAYLNCNALVVREPASGKYGLFVDGEQHYDFIYDSIQPLKSDLVWAEKTMGSASALLKIRAVSSAGYPQPQSYSFVLEKDGQKEYVALSAQTTYPIRLEGEF